MMPITHVCGALALAGAILGPNPVLLEAGVVGAVLPDLDELQSPMGWRVGQWLSHPRFGIGRQRTYLLCSSLGGVVVGCPFDLLASWWIGWASHMLLDMCSGGVPLWWPWASGQAHRVRLASWRGWRIMSSCV